MTPAVAVLAVDGGNSKADLALVSRDGALLELARGPTVSHQQLEMPTAMTRLADLAHEAHRRAGTDGRAELGSYCLAGADFPSDVRSLERAIGASGLASRSIVRNDAHAALRAGAEHGWGIVVVCGAGVNALGVAPDGRSARLAGVGDISGDWGGGYALGMAALGAAVRARDGRGDATSLSRLVPAHFGLGRPIDVTRGLYEGRLAHRRLEELAPLVMEAAPNDGVARGIVDRLADELAVMAIAIARRLRIARREVDVVLTGGVFRATDRGFAGRLDERVRAGVPHARKVRLRERPVLGAALIGLDAIGARVGGPEEQQLREDFGRLS
jgi:N-acetylglucosamine kinase-like BadF-type ATPase